MQITNEEDEDDYSHGVFLSDKQKRRLWGDDWEKVLKSMKAVTEVKPPENNSNS